jgi:hypothetical protein
MKNGNKSTTSYRPNSSKTTTKIKITNYSICNAKNLIIDGGRVTNTKPIEYKITSGGLSKFTHSDITTEALTETCSGINVINIITSPKSGNFKCPNSNEGKLLKFSEGISNRLNIMRLYDSTFSKNKNKVASSSKSNKTLIIRSNK